MQAPASEPTPTTPPVPVGRPLAARVAIVLLRIFTPWWAILLAFCLGVIGILSSLPPLDDMPASPDDEASGAVDVWTQIRNEGLPALLLAGVVLVPAIRLSSFYRAVRRRPLTPRACQIGWSSSAFYHALMTWLVYRLEGFGRIDSVLDRPWYPLAFFFPQFDFHLLALPPLLIFGLEITIRLWTIHLGALIVSLLFLFAARSAAKPRAAVAL